MTKSARVLVVDDEDFVRESLEALLSARGYHVRTARGGLEAVEILRGGEIDVVLTDMKMPQGDGNSLLRTAQSEGLDVPVLVLSGASSVTEAVTAMKCGAYDLLEKPAEPERLTSALERALERGRLRREIRGLRATLRLPRTGRRWVARSPAALRVKGAVANAAHSRAPVLLTGPSGVGKGVVAEELHRAGERASEPFVRVDCAALSSSEVARVLFGERAQPELRAGEGAGRVTLAEGGTLLLDEVGALGLEAQARLLSLIENGEYQRVGEQRIRRANVRVIATSNKKLRAEVESGVFREDLYWRLDVLRIDVPTLELRREDLPQLVAELEAELGGASDSRQPLTLEANALTLLESYSWPGNVRELRSVLERALLLAADGAQIGEVPGELSREVIGLALDSHLSGELRDPSGNTGTDLSMRANLLALERRLVLEAIKRTRGKRAEAADLLGVDSRNLGYYFRKHRISDEELEIAARG